MHDEIFVGIDLGSSAIRAVVGKLDEAQPGALRILAASEEPSEGIAKGAIVGIENAVSSVSRCLEKAERMAGVPLERAWIALTEPHILAEISRGVVGVSRSDGEIHPEDIERAIEAAKTMRAPSNYQILHMLPKAFTVDGQSGIKDPVGMNGIRLEVEAHIIQALASQLKNVSKCIYRTGLEINDIVVGVLASALAVLNQRQKDLGVVLVNIGAATTSLVVMEEGEVLHLAILPLGSEHITNDLAIGLRTSIEVAERIKKQVGHAVPESVSKKDEINLIDFGAPAEEIASKRFVADVIQARVQEIFEKVSGELRKIRRDGMLPAGVVLTGGGAKLAGLVEAAKHELRLPAMLGTTHGVVSVSEAAMDPAFSTSVGLVKWGLEMMEDGDGRSMFSKIKNIGKVFSGVKKLFKGLMP